MMKALFLDRDGVINEIVRKIDPYYKRVMDNSPFTPEEVKFVAGIEDLISRARNSGYKVLVVTNQPSVLKGSFSLKDYEEVTTKICNHLGLARSEVFNCLHREGFSLECECRKPKPGLFLMAKGMYDIDLKNSVMIGDSKSDIEAARAAKVGKTIYLRRKPSSEQSGNVEDEKKMMESKITPDHIVSSLDEVVLNG